MKLSIFEIILIQPIINVLVAVYHVLLSFHVPYTLGFSIIVLTALIRLLLYPFIHSQLKTSKKMQDLSPQLSRLKEKHKSDSKKLQEETMKLYKEFGVNPAAGCLPLLVQIPLIMGLYQVLNKVVDKNPDVVLSYVNKMMYVPSLKLDHIWDVYFFGLPLAKHPAELFSAMPLILLIPLITGALQFVQAKMMAPAVAPQKKKGDDFASAMQTQTTYLMPLMLAVFSYSLPVGLSLYWNTFTIFGILQQYQISGLGALTEYKEKLWKK